MKRRSFLTMLGAMFVAPKIPNATAALGVAFPTINWYFPPLLVEEIIAVQPMSGPIAEVFAMDLIGTKTDNTITEDEELKRGYCPELARIRRGLPRGRTTNLIILDDV